MRIVLTFALTLTAATPALAQDGAALFAGQCKSCHTVSGPSSPAGPSLKGVVGRKAATAPGFNYSPGLKAKGGTWTDATLDAYLTGPSAYAPGTKMFARVAQPQARAAIIAYLKTQK
jgi:cytochrome c